MRKGMFLVGLILAFGATSFAQSDFPSVEVFGGYSYANIDRAGWVSRRNANGWGTSLSGNFHRNFGFTADLGGHYGDTEVSCFFIILPAIFPPPPCPQTNSSAYQFLFGPRLTVRTGRVTGFLHALVGGTHTRLSSHTVDGFTFPASSETDLALGLGSGMDVRLNRRFALRAFQLDFIPAQPDGFWLYHVRVQTGIVFKFGGGR